MERALIQNLNIHVSKLDCYEDERGILSVISNIQEKYFQVQRIFFISEFAEGSTRGQHGHFNCKQILVCLNGAFVLNIKHNGKDFQIEISKNELVFVPNRIWIQLLSRKKETTVAVLCSHDFDKTDYFYEPT